MSKILPLIILFALIASLLNYVPLKRELAYRFGVSGDQTTSCCDASHLSKTGDFDENANLAVFDNEVIDYPKTSLAQTNRLAAANPASNVLGATNAAGEEKWIDVDLQKQQLTAYEGDKIVMQFLISSGKWAPTPTGDFRIWYKTRSQRMVGGSKELGTYYNLPNVPSNMFFYQGYGIHGAYWHNNFGHPMSHGCVNAPLAQAAELFNWTGPDLPEGVNALKASDDNPGTRVHIH